MTYTLLKKILDNGNRFGSITLDKLDVFFLANRINQEQYNELLDILNGNSDSVGNTNSVSNEVIN